MTELKTIIKSIIAKEISLDENVVDNSFVLDPYMNENALKGDGHPEEITTSYQLDIFFKNKGELIAKSKLLAIALGDYPMNEFVFNYEGVARLWRGTVTIQTI